MEEIAQVYSRALFEAAQEQAKLDVVREQVGAFADALEENRDLAVFFFSPYFSTEEKVDDLRRTVSDADPTVLNFLELLVEKHRMPAIFRIRRGLDKLWEEVNRRLAVEITSAVDLDQEIVDRIGKRIGEQTGQTIELSTQVDPDLLGGLVVRVGNSVLDASIRNRLETFRKQVARAT